MNARNSQSQLFLPVGRTARSANRQINSGRKRLKPLGRPRTRDRGATHDKRPELAKNTVLHVTLKLRKGMPALRQERTYAHIVRALAKFAGVTVWRKEDFRLVHFSVQNDHVHMVVEADHRRALSKGIQKIALSISRRLNNFSMRRGRGWLGKLFRERYHAKEVATPTQARHALVYVLNNFRKHGGDRGPRGYTVGGFVDGYSSAAWFDGFTSEAHPVSWPARAAEIGTGESFVREPRSGLLKSGWRRRGLIDCEEPPRS